MITDPPYSAADLPEEPLCPRPSTEQDAAALIGILATISGHSAAGLLGADLDAALRRRMTHDGLLHDAASSAALQDALGDLVERLRYALGEYSGRPLST